MPNTLSQGSGFSRNFRQMPLEAPPAETPLSIVHSDGSIIFQLNRDGTFQADWPRVEEIAATLPTSKGNTSVIICAAILAVRDSK